MIDFTKIEYLKSGTARQQHAHEVLLKHKIVEKLAAFEPILTGTIPLNIDIETSDLDIICCFSDRAGFQHHLVNSFTHEQDFKIFSPKHAGAVAASFWLDDFEIEIFGQPVPTQHQAAYRHMLVEHKILTEKGEAFRQQIIELKKQGYKTEPAFGKLLGLTGTCMKNCLPASPEHHSRKIPRKEERHSSFKNPYPAPAYPSTPSPMDFS